MAQLLKISSLFVIVVGIALVVGGLWGIAFTYKNITQEKIVTPADASIPEKPVRGPLTLKAQADIIREHTLKSTGDKTFAEMPRQISKLDENNQQVLDANGKPVMVANTARDIWITATTLTTALSLGILSYAFSSLIVLFGLISIWIGVVFGALVRRGKLV
ncbi:MAG: hypothetical protein A3A04_01840 [Candidatus Harrisonbacteria bacterium RIFCSPLOWO2_01_FULL_40_28]|uniref:Aromatic ring-opening dioxygenase LigA n=1 Tax=Candidatus Harrisonbacteria bacterium RIFCSPLOWO2_01_FULL_40_28 TaxID=1798406 RepID=A0A1G1ZJS0_9BACT|nr:MAG: hypothetical protein A3A04_01840 [Candidatus Harrisonbacteria bacterium RIFCSPLOWO2_01_FULL_40_28]